MSSSIVNVNSALTYISSMSGLPLSVVREWFANESTYRNNALNIKSAYNIINRMLGIGFRSSITINNSQVACSVDTFKSIYNSAMSGRAWNIVSSTDGILYDKQTVSLQDMTIEYIMVGGGGGGSGGGKTNFDGSGTLTIQKGADGGSSKIIVNDVVIDTAAGGTGGAGQTASKGNRDAGSGTNGSNGATSSSSTTLNKGDYIRLLPGYGGGGSGAGVLRVTKNNSYSGTVYTPSKNNGGNAGQFGNYNNRCPSGGGSGGCGWDETNTYIVGTIGSASNSGASDGQNGNAGGVLLNYPNGTFAVGGAGGNSGSVASGGAGGQSAGAGGKAGNTSGTNGYASGGGGGASGYIYITTATAYFNIL